MDFIFEFLFQIVFEFIGEALLDAGFHGASRFLGSKIGRYTVAVAVGFGAGAWWGSYLSDAGAGHRPRLFVVSIVLGVAATVAAVIRVGWPHKNRARGFRAHLAESVAPWQWPADRLAAFAAMNVAIAAGIAVAYAPPIPG
jgi:hypothetical protein